MRYSESSKSKLITVHPALQIVCLSVLMDGYDNKVTDGERGEYEQNKAYAEGTSTVHYPNSKHNRKPHKDFVYAVDVVPYPVIWPDKKNRPETFAKDLARFYMFAGYVRCKAKDLGVPIVQGADWNGNFDINDQKFDDLPHIEIDESAFMQEINDWSRRTLREFWQKYVAQERG